MDGDVRMVPAPGADLDDYVLVHWSYVGDAAPWQRTSLWQPTAEPDRIAALEQRVAELEAMVRPSAELPAERAQDELIAAMANRLSSLEQLFWAHKHEAQPVSIPAEAQP
jgi:hypothetical protein